MAGTSTAVNACDVVIRMDDDTGNLKNISGSSNRFDAEFMQEIGEYNTFGDAWTRRLACRKDSNLSLQLVYTEASDEGYDILKQWYFAGAGAKKRTLQINIPDDTIGSDRYEAEVFIESFSMTGDASEASPILVDLQLVPDGAVTLSTVAT